MNAPKKEITIWFLVGVILLVYGLTITGCGIYNMFNPDPHLVGNELHLDFWWGIVMGIGGGIFLYTNRPRVPEE